MTTASQKLASFAASLRLDDIPELVVARARDCIIDTAAVCSFGSQLPWSRMVAEYAVRYGNGGPCDLLGIPGASVHAPFAALANGASAHAFEQDCVTEPGMGMHAGATLVPAVFAMGQECNADGKLILTAFVAGCEVMYRIALASQHSPEKVGFHAPALTGCYGAALAAGVVLGLDGPGLAAALGIAGSLSSGLLAFSKSGRVLRRTPHRTRGTDCRLGNRMAYAQD